MNSEDALYPCSFVIFGATGHLAATKLLPALYRLELEKRLPLRESGQQGSGLFPHPKRVGGM